jgi:hypothetical protein
MDAIEVARGHQSLFSYRCLLDELDFPPNE